MADRKCSGPNPTCPTACYGPGKVQRFRSYKVDIYVENTGVHSSSTLGGGGEYHELGACTKLEGSGGMLPGRRGVLVYIYTYMRYRPCLAA